MWKLKVVIDKKMEENTRTAYKRRLEEVLKSKLNGKAIINAIRAVSIIRYSSGIVKRKINKLQELDRKPRKLLTMCNASHGKGDVDIQKSEGGGLFSVENCVLIDRNRLCEYARAKPEPVVKGAEREAISEPRRDRKTIRASRKRKLKNRSFHSIFSGQTEFEETRNWDWMKCGDLKRATEGTLLATQEQAIRTSAIKHQVDRENISTFSRLCGERGDYVETIAHLISVYKPCIETVQILGT